MHKYSFTLFCFILSTLFIHAQTPAFTVSVSTDSLLMGNILQVEFALQNTTGSQFEAPIFEGFEVVGGPNQSSSYQVMNGNVSQSLSYSYFLRPTDVGAYYISPASIETPDGIQQTAPIEIMVYPNPDGIQQTEPRRDNPFWMYDLSEKPTPPMPPASKPKKKRKTYRL